MSEIPSKIDNTGRSGHFVKKSTKHRKAPESKSSVGEAIPMTEQEHDEMIRIATVSLYSHLKQRK